MYKDVQINRQSISQLKKCISKSVSQSFISSIFHLKWILLFKLSPRFPPPFLFLSLPSFSFPSFSFLSFLYNLFIFPFYSLYSLLLQHSHSFFLNSYLLFFFFFLFFLILYLLSFLPFFSFLFSTFLASTSKIHTCQTLTHTTVNTLNYTKLNQNADPPHHEHPHTHTRTHTHTYAYKHV